MQLVGDIHFPSALSHSKLNPLLTRIPLPISTQKNRQNKALNASSPYGAFASHVSPKPEAVPEDLCDMFCTLLLDPDETIPVEVS